MGLPSGTKWAKFDIDLTQPDGFCASEFQHEKTFFSWGNVQGHNPINNSFIDVYNWGGMNAQEPWYEGQPYGETPGSLLQQSIEENPSYDAAVANLGNGWHIPTWQQFAELLSNIDYLNADGTIKDVSEVDKRITKNEIVGVWMQSRINGKRLFFACSGNASNTEWIHKNEDGHYWTATIVSARVSISLAILGNSVNSGYSFRYYGCPIRPVQG